MQDNVLEEVPVFGNKETGILISSLFVLVNIYNFCPSLFLKLGAIIHAQSYIKRVDFGVEASKRYQT